MAALDEIRGAGAALIAAAVARREIVWPHGWPERFHILTQWCEQCARSRADAKTMPWDFRLDEWFHRRHRWFPQTWQYRICNWVEDRNGF